MRKNARRGAPTHFVFGGRFVRFASFSSVCACFVALAWLLFATRVHGYCAPHSLQLVHTVRSPFINDLSVLDNDQSLEEIRCRFASEYSPKSRTRFWNDYCIFCWCADLSGVLIKIDHTVGLKLYFIQNTFVRYSIVDVFCVRYVSFCVGCGEFWRQDIKFDL